MSQSRCIPWSEVATLAGNRFETRGVRSRRKVSVEFVELGVMGQWCRRLKVHREAYSSSQRWSWWRGIGGWVDGKSE